MIMDGVMLHAVAHELQQLVGGRVDKISQPEKDEIILGVYHKGQHKLMLSANAAGCRVCLTGVSKENPPAAPMFCMLLRKRLIGSRITKIYQISLERILVIELEGTGEFGEKSGYKLMVEIMGRYSNIILTGSQDIIIDSIKRVNETKSRLRHILPNLPYALPPAQNKQNPLELSPSGFDAIISGYTSGMLPNFLASRLLGISIPTAAEIVVRAFFTEDKTLLDDMDKQLLQKTLLAFFQDVQQCNFKAYVAMDNALPVAFMPFEYVSYGAYALQPKGSPSKALDVYYEIREKADKLFQRASALTKSIEARIQKAQKKLAIQQDAIHQQQKMEDYKKFGELLTASLHTIKRGAKTATVFDYYTNEYIEIPLDERISPSANAQRYFKLYNKAKVAKNLALAGIDETQQELNYLEGQLLSVENSTEPKELNEIRAELESVGYLKPSSLTRKKSKTKVEISLPLHFVSKDGHDMYVGKNNSQNEYLTLKTATSDDMWLHVKNMPGSHVIIKAKDGQVSSDAIDQGAMLAAYYSKARNSSNVPVDYTLRRNVKKPAGARPGMVIYVNNKTAYITPDEKEVESIRKA